MKRVASAVLALLLAAGVATGDAAAQSNTKTKPGRAEVEESLKRLFPAGHREGREGAMRLGGQFRTVTVRTWEACREVCLKNPAQLYENGCVLWTFIKAQDAKMPSICRMWWELPDLKDNTWAVSGAGKLK